VPDAAHTVALDNKRSPAAGKSGDGPNRDEDLTASAVSSFGCTSERLIGIRTAGGNALMSSLEERQQAATEEYRCVIVSAVGSNLNPQKP
jgi:hypothetical protein